MSKGPVRRPTISDDELNRRKIAAINDLRKNQLGILQDLLLNQRSTNNNRPTRVGKSSKINRPISAKSCQSSDWNPTDNTRKTRSQSRSRTNNNSSLTSDIDQSTSQFRKLIIRLSSELCNLETMTGFKSNKIELLSNSSSTTLANALLGLVGHVKQCASSSDEIQHLKDRISIMMRNQLDFQEKIENQVATLQTMMQTICQLVNNEIVSKKKQSDTDFTETRSNWLENAQRPYIIEKDTTNAMDELLQFTRHMNNDIMTPPSENRLSMISPIEAPLFESMQRPEPNPLASTSSATETILEKILQERLRLVQQMNELNKQHEMTQEELASLEANVQKS